MKRVQPGQMCWRLVSRIHLGALQTLTGKAADAVVNEGG